MWPCLGWRPKQAYKPGSVFPFFCQKKRVTIIHLGCPLPDNSSDRPGGWTGRLMRPPIWSCFGWGLPCRSRYRETRCALTTPFHPYRCVPTVILDKDIDRRFAFCGTFPRVTPAGRYPASYPIKPGLSSRSKWNQRPSSLLRL